MVPQLRHQFWSLFALKQDGYEIMEELMYVVILGTSIWVLFDAKSIGVKKGLVTGIANMGPWTWFFVCLFLWIVGFPVYLAKRGELKRAASMQLS